MAITTLDYTDISTIPEIIEWDREMPVNIKVVNGFGTTTGVSARIALRPHIDSSEIYLDLNSTDDPGSFTINSAFVIAALSIDDLSYIPARVKPYRIGVTLQTSTELLKPLNAQFRLIGSAPDAGNGVLLQTDADNFGGANATDGYLIDATLHEAWAYSAINRDSDGVVTTASVIWTDGATGTFTTTTKNTTFLTVDAFTVTHSLSGQTVTQSAVTRNSNGNITIRPIPTVA